MEWISERTYIAFIIIIEWSSVYQSIFVTWYQQLPSNIDNMGKSLRPKQCTAIPSWYENEHSILPSALTGLGGIIDTIARRLHGTLSSQVDGLDVIPRHLLRHHRYHVLELPCHLVMFRWSGMHTKHFYGMSTMWRNVCSWSGKRTCHLCIALENSLYIVSKKKENVHLISKIWLIDSVEEQRN